MKNSTENPWNINTCFVVFDPTTASSSFSSSSSFSFYFSSIFHSVIISFYLIVCEYFCEFRIYGFNLLYGSLIILCLSVVLLDL